MPSTLFWQQFYNPVFDSQHFYDDASLHPAKEILCFEANCATLKNPFPRAIDTKSDGYGEPPSKLHIEYDDALLYEIAPFLQKNGVFQNDVLIRGTLDYPEKLNFYDVPLLYYKGDISLLSSPCIAIGGTGRPSKEGEKLTTEVTKLLVSSGYTIVSGLGLGVNTVAHKTALANGGHTIGVLGTSLGMGSTFFDKELEEEIAQKNLVVSHVPFFRSAKMDPKERSLYFPDRYKIIVALSAAVVITDVRPTNKKMALAREAVKQGKPLVFTKNVLDVRDLQWPREYAQEMGAIVAVTPKYVQKVLESVCRIG